MKNNTIPAYCWSCKKEYQIPKAGYYFANPPKCPKGHEAVITTLGKHDWNNGCGSTLWFQKSERKHAELINGNIC
jgi:hypothetical protein